MNNESEINALIQLLDDNDTEVFNHVHHKLKSFGQGIIPVLEQAWVSQLNPAAHSRIEDIINEIYFDTLVNEWKQWLTDSDNPDLLTGAFLVAKYHHPEIALVDLQKKIQKIKQSIGLELNNHQTPLEQVQIFNQVLYSIHNFKGLQSSFDYQDYCINCLLDNKKGSAICIGIIYQLVAMELNLPVYGVPLFRHFILAFCKRTILDFSDSGNLEKEVMFYINPINKGSVFSRNEIKDYLEKMKVVSNASYFKPATNLSIIKELLKSLIETFTHLNRLDRVKELNQLMELMA